MFVKTVRVGAFLLRKGVTIVHATKVYLALIGAIVDKSKATTLITKTSICHPETKFVGGKCASKAYITGRKMDKLHNAVSAFFT